MVKFHGEEMEKLERDPPIHPRSKKFSRARLRRARYLYLEYYQIVANEVCDIDVDKINYIQREIKQEEKKVLCG
jgi:hypothetical protein